MSFSCISILGHQKRYLCVGGTSVRVERRLYGKEGGSDGKSRGPERVGEGKIVITNRLRNEHQR